MVQKAQSLGCFCELQGKTQICALNGVVLRWSNRKGGLDLHQSLRINKWAFEIKVLSFSSLPQCWDGRCAELPAEITDTSKEVTPAKGCAQLCREPKNRCSIPGCCCNCVWPVCVVGSCFFDMKTLVFCCFYFGETK